jgi:hypothetical protein
MLIVVYTNHFRFKNNYLNNFSLIKIKFGKEKLQMITFYWYNKSTDLQHVHTELLKNTENTTKIVCNLSYVKYTFVTIEIIIYGY